MNLRWLVLFFCCSALASNPVTSSSPRTELRAAQDAIKLGDNERANAIYSGVEGRTDDPGLVAFNLGVLRFRDGKFREAELQFHRCLDDRVATEERRANSWFNRGTCLLKIGGLAQFRAAVECFQLASKSVEAESDFGRDIAHNLELAKLLWLEARAASPNKPLPNEQPPEVPPEMPSPEKKTDSDKSNNEPSTGGTEQNPNPAIIDPSTAKPKTGATTKKTTGGNGNLPVTNEWAGWQPETDGEARDFLRELGRRLARDRRNWIETTAPPEPPRVKNW